MTDQERAALARAVGGYPISCRDVAAGGGGCGGHAAQWLSDIERGRRGTQSRIREKRLSRLAQTLLTVMTRIMLWVFLAELLEVGGQPGAGLGSRVGLGGVRTRS